MINRRVSASIALLVPLLIVTSCATVRDDTYRSRLSARMVEWSYTLDGSEKVAQGEWTVFHDNNTASVRRLYDDGVITGEYRAFYPDGKIRIRGQFDEDGQAIDSWSSYFPNGQIRSEGKYENGMRNGLWRFWDEQGVEHTQVTYTPRDFERTFLVPPTPFPEGADPDDLVYCSTEGMFSELAMAIAELERCFPSPKDKGKLEFLLGIGRRGEVTAVRVSPSTFGRRTNSCVKDVVAKSQFRPPVGGICQARSQISTRHSVIEIRYF